MPRTNLSSQFTPEERAAFKPKIIARNTFRYTRDGATVIRLHATDVVIRKGDSVELHDGGWRTVTTKDRINSQMPAGYMLLQERGLWYVSKRPAEGSGKSWWQGERVPYFDGICVPQCFDKLPTKAIADNKRQFALRAKVKAFVGKLDKLECLPEPSQGDCWMCHMHTDKGESLGDVIHDKSHVLSHVKEGYLHGSLIWNALLWAGYRNPSFIWQMDSRDMASGRKPASVKRALKRYLYRQLGLVS